MARKITREQALRKALVAVFGNNDAQVQWLIETEFLLKLESVGYTITDIDTAWRGADLLLTEKVAGAHR